ncbi:unnamed protein product [Rhodiola kirilowii]
MAKLSPVILFIAALLVSTIFISNARPSPTYDESFEQQNVEVLSEDVGCEGLSEDACLEKSTSNAHIDYIYTQHLRPHKP